MRIVVVAAAALLAIYLQGCKTSSDPKNDFVLMTLNEKYSSLPLSEKKAYWRSYGSLSRSDCEKKIKDEYISLVRDPELVTTIDGLTEIKKVKAMTLEKREVEISLKGKDTCDAFIFAYKQHI